MARRDRRLRIGNLLPHPEVERSSAYECRLDGVVHEIGPVLVAE
ncbi:MAG: hypothetical protein AB1714_15535 [Acidobacteriota bacterium]